jgi:fructose-1,6-bisphosphatase
MPIDGRKRQGGSMYGMCPQAYNRNLELIGCLPMHTSGVFPT